MQQQKQCKKVNASKRISRRSILSINDTSDEISCFPFESRVDWSNLYFAWESIPRCGFPVDLNTRHGFEYSRWIWILAVVLSRRGLSRRGFEQSRQIRVGAIDPALHNCANNLCGRTTRQRACFLIIQILHQLRPLPEPEGTASSLSIAELSILTEPLYHPVHD